jgi:hypothetical protein
LGRTEKTFPARLFNTLVPEFINPVFAKTGLKCSFSVIDNERFGLVFAKTGSIISGTSKKWNQPGFNRDILRRARGTKSVRIGIFWSTRTPSLTSLVLSK